jgi:hypothetical protein
MKRRSMTPRAGTNPPTKTMEQCKWHCMYTGISYGTNGTCMSRCIYCIDHKQQWYVCVASEDHTVGLGTTNGDKPWWQCLPVTTTHMSSSSSSWVLDQRLLRILTVKMYYALRWQEHKRMSQEIWKPVLVQNWSIPIIFGHMCCISDQK